MARTLRRVAAALTAVSAASVAAAPGPVAPAPQASQASLPPAPGAAAEPDPGTNGEAAAEDEPAEQPEAAGRIALLGLSAVLGAAFVAHQADSSGGDGTIRDDDPDDDPPPPHPPDPREPDGEAPSFEARHLTVTGADDAHEIGITGDSAQIAVLDSDFRTTHREYRERAKYIRHYDPARRELSELEARIHGTHVASLAGGRQVGTAPGAELTLHADGPGTGAWSYEAFRSGIEAIDAADPAVLNLSVAYRDPQGVILDDLTTFAEGGEDGRVVVLAAGNNGEEGPVGDVASNIDAFDGRGVVAGALNKNGELAWFSNTAGGDEAVQAHYLAAPGTEILGASPGTDSEYRLLSGTSMSAPQIAGAAALLRGEWEHLSAEETAEILLETADDDFEDYDPAVYGQGRLDIEAALQAQGEILIPDAEGQGGEPAAASGLIADPGLADALEGSDALADAVVLDRYGRDFPADYTAAVEAAAPAPALEEHLAAALTRAEPATEAAGRIEVQRRLRPTADGGEALSSATARLHGALGTLTLAQHHRPDRRPGRPGNVAFSPGTWHQPDPDLGELTRVQRVSVATAPVAGISVHARAAWADSAAEDPDPLRWAAGGAGEDTARARTHSVGARLHLAGARLEARLRHSELAGHSSQIAGTGAFAPDGAAHTHHGLALRLPLAASLDLLAEHRRGHYDASTESAVITGTDLTETTYRIGLEGRIGGRDRLGAALGRETPAHGTVELAVPRGVNADGEVVTEREQVAVAPEPAWRMEAFWERRLDHGRLRLGGLHEAEQRAAYAAWTARFGN